MRPPFRSRSASCRAGKLATRSGRIKEISRNYGERESPPALLDIRRTDGGHLRAVALSPPPPQTCGMSSAALTAHPPSPPGHWLFGHLLSFHNDVLGNLVRWSELGPVVQLRLLN